MKKIVSYLCILSIICMLFSACGAKNTVSEDCQAVLNACINTPNSELFDPDMMYHTNMSEEEKAQVLQLQEQINDNWVTLLGEYFSPGSFNLFLNSYLRSWFYAYDPIPSTLKTLTLVSKDSKLEVVDVEVDISGELYSFTITFHRNEDGLFYRIDMEEKNE